MTGVSIWHINADEPDLIDYDTSFKVDAQDAIYAPDAYRSSDHDPVIVGLDLCEATPTLTRRCYMLDRCLKIAWISRASLCAVMQTKHIAGY